MAHQTTDQGIISEQVASLWDTRTDVLIKALTLRGYKIVDNNVWESVKEEVEGLSEEIRHLSEELAMRQEALQDARWDDAMGD